jgi:5-methyltetrahydropteroyltriglutamate--homocysteine methyltransferase
MKALTLGRPYDPQKLAADVRRGVGEVVRKQVEAGIDIPGDGEYRGRSLVGMHAMDRFEGIAPRPHDPDEDDWNAYSDPEQQAFPEFFEQYHKHFRYIWMLPEVSIDDVPNLPGNYQRFRVVGPIRYKGQAALLQDIDNLKTALQGYTVSDAFMTAVTPTQRGARTDRDALSFYPSEDAYLYAWADALHEEYRAVVDAGFILQIDLGAVNPRRQLSMRDASPDAIQRATDQGVEVVNYALRDIPEDRVRYHHCWGSMNSPHTRDAPLIQFVHSMLKINAQAYVIEAANPRHEHEWMVWKDVKLPDGKILVPGVISHQTNVVEHPELVAWRINNFASVVGKENVIASTDCGFSQYWDMIRVHPTVQWAKLRALSEGAALASRELWGG